MRHTAEHRYGTKTAPVVARAPVPVEHASLVVAPPRGPALAAQTRVHHLAHLLHFVCLTSLHFVPSYGAHLGLGVQTHGAHSGAGAHVPRKELTAPVVTVAPVAPVSPVVGQTGEELVRQLVAALPASHRYHRHAQRLRAGRGSGGGEGRTDSAEVYFTYVRYVVCVLAYRTGTLNPTYVRTSQTFLSFLSPLATTYPTHSLPYPTHSLPLVDHHKLLHIYIGGLPWGSLAHIERIISLSLSPIAYSL